MQKNLIGVKMLPNSNKKIFIFFNFQSSSICFAKDYGKVFPISAEKLAQADVTIATKTILSKEFGCIN